MLHDEFSYFTYRRYYYRMAWKPVCKRRYARRNYRVYDRRSYWRLDRTRAAWNMGAAPSRICHYSSGNRRSHCCLSSKPVNQKKRIKAAAPKASALWVFVLP
ncbi:Hypothetical protein YdaS [Bacillus subtilis subsp. subtilis str. BSP1]|nr:Hypothetical protein YdaS [Bacillus subtilis subsp. subtilis str. BSP1]